MDGGTWVGRRKGSGWKEGVGRRQGRVDRRKEYKCRAANINQLIILTYCLKILIFYHTKILRYPKTIIIIL